MGVWGDSYDPSAGLLLAKEFHVLWDRGDLALLPMVSDRTNGLSRRVFRAEPSLTYASVLLLTLSGA